MKVKTEPRKNPLTGKIEHVPTLDIDTTIEELGSEFLGLKVHAALAQSSAGLSSDVPAGNFKVTKLYVNASTGKLVVEYDDTPA